MKTINLLDGFIRYELTELEIKDLFTKAEHAMQFTFPNPNEGFAVSVMTAQGNVYTGASYKSDTHNLTMHSEAVALARAAQHGEQEIAAITGPNCHNCKQLIWESSIRSKIDTVIVIEEDSVYKQVPISELMLYPWPDKNGKH